MFRQLNEKEEQEFRQWARENFDPSKDEINTVWHPIVQHECVDMNTEYMNEQVKLLPSVEEILQMKGE